MIIFLRHIKLSNFLRKTFAGKDVLYYNVVIVFAVIILFSELKSHWYFLFFWLFLCHFYSGKRYGAVVIYSRNMWIVPESIDEFNRIWGDNVSTSAVVDHGENSLSQAAVDSYVDKNLLFR